MMIVKKVKMVKVRIYLKHYIIENKYLYLTDEEIGIMKTHINNSSKHDKNSCLNIIYPDYFCFVDIAGLEILSIEGE